MKLGCIGDDFTGSSDLANTLAKGGMKTVQLNGIPNAPLAADVDAAVIALKSRSIDPQAAIDMSLQAMQWLLDQGAEQIFFKYCSTFDSTPDGNIGPVSDALADALKANKVIACPAFPTTGRSIYQGHLFVGDRLLNESGMQNHPLTPMTDPDLRRWLGLQSKNSVGLVSMADVGAGVEATKDALTREDNAGHRLIIVDAINDANLFTIGEAANGLPLITGGSGVALGLPANFGCSAGDVPWSGQAGKTVILSGSCSIATRGQIDLHKKTNPVRQVTAASVIEGTDSPEDAAAWLMAQDGLPLLFSSADPADVKAAQVQFGQDKAAQAIEGFFAEVARQVRALGATKIITAGGETSGAVVEGLELAQFEIGPEIDPGVPALRAGTDLVVALKSGNFGAPDFFVKADRVLGG